MDYRVAIQRQADHLDRPPSWQWKSTELSSLETLFQFLRLYGALRLEHLRVFSSSSREGLQEQLVQENQGLESPSVTAAQFLQERMIDSPEMAWRTSTRRTCGNERTSIAVVTEPLPNESNRGGKEAYRAVVAMMEPTTAV